MFLKWLSAVFAVAVSFLTNEYYAVPPYIKGFALIVLALLGLDAYLGVQVAKLDGTFTSHKLRTRTAMKVGIYTAFGVVAFVISRVLNLWPVMMAQIYWVCITELTSIGENSKKIEAHGYELGKVADLIEVFSAAIPRLPSRKEVSPGKVSQLPLGIVCAFLLLSSTGCGQGFRRNGDKWEQMPIRYRIIREGQTSDIRLSPVTAEPFTSQQVEAIRAAIKDIEEKSEGGLSFVEDDSVSGEDRGIIIYSQTLPYPELGNQQWYSDGGIARSRCIINHAIKSKRQFDSVATHEIMHGLGFKHSENPSSVMFPWNFASVTPTRLTAGDAVKLRKVYPSPKQ